jgi:hypothetical protein
VKNGEERKGLGSPEGRPVHVRCGEHHSMKLNNTNS